MAASCYRCLLCAAMQQQQPSDNFPLQFKCYVYFNFVIACGYGVEALTNHIASVVAVAFLLDALLMAWLASFTFRTFASRKLQCIAGLSIVTSAFTLGAAVGLQGYALWLADFAGGLGSVLWEQGPAVLTFSLVVCVFKVLTLPAANSFRLWRMTGKGAVGAMGSSVSPRSTATLAMAVP